MERSPSNFTLNQLFPFDLNKKGKNQNLKDQLKVYKTILIVAIECCHHWHHRNYSLFDALVAENACQIRTFWIISHALNGSIQTENLKGHCLAALKLVNDFLLSESLRDSKGNGHLLGDLFQRHDQLEVNLSQDEMFLFLTYLLCKMIDKKDSNESRVVNLCMTDKADLCCFSPNIGTNQADKFNYKSRVLLSQLSVEYIKSLGLAYYPESFALFQENRETKTHLSIFPMFWTYEIVLNHARKEGIPLLVYTKFATNLIGTEEYEIRDEEVALFESKNSIYERVPITNFCERPVCVIEGITVNKSMGRMAQSC